MALSAPTVLNAKASGSSNVTSDSVSPTANALVIAIIAGANASGTFDPNGITETGTLDLGAWTIHEFIQGSGTQTFGVAIATAQAAAVPGSGTLAYTFASFATIRTVLAILEVTGHDTDNPVPQSDEAEGILSTLTVTLSSTPAASSMVLAACNSRDGTGTTPGTDFTELVDMSSGGAPLSRLQVQYNLTDADTTADWSTLSTSNNSGVAIEIAEAGGAVVVRVARLGLLGVS